VVFLHGRHETCYRPETGRLSVAWPCPDGTEAVPSHRGFTYLQRQQLVLYLPEQTTTASLRIPTVADSLTEGAEWLRLELSDELGNPVGTSISGRVTDG
jgi:hypothetical protein